MYYDPFVLPFTIGLNILLIYLVIKYARWIRTFSPEDKRTIRRNLFSLKIWVFSISEARVIDYDKNDKSLVTAMTTEVPSSKLCIGCGGCSATCTAGNLTEFNIRKLQMLVKRGETKEVGEHLQKCMLCGKCLLVCPRGVDTRRMILSMLKYINSL